MEAEKLAACDINGNSTIESSELLTSNQVDFQSRGIGDACNSDIDGDGTNNESDECPYLERFGKGGDSRLCDEKVDGILNTILSPPRNITE